MAQQPVIEGGIGTGSWSTEEGARLSERKPIQVRQSLLSEIFTKAHKGKVKKDKVKILKEENCRALQQICQWAYNPKIKSMLPEGTEHMLLRTEGDRLYNFIKGAQTHQSTVRERMFIRLLEGLHKDEAELLINVKDKRLHQVYKGVSSDVVKEAFDWDENFKVKGV